MGATTPEALPPLSSRGATPESIGGASDATAPEASLTARGAVRFEAPESTSRRGFVGATAPKAPSIAEEIDAKWAEKQAAATKKLSGYDEIEFKWKEFQARFDEVNKKMVTNLAQSLNAEFAAQQKKQQQEKVTSLRNLQRSAKKTA